MKVLKEVNPNFLNDAFICFFEASADWEFSKAKQGVDVELKSKMECPIRFASVEREKEWAESRRALNRLEQRKKIKSISISHSNGQVLTVGIHDDQRIERIGVDLEASGRLISKSVAMRFIQPEEREFLLSALDFWVIKEACFKADPGNQGKIISEYTVQNFSWQSQEGTIRVPSGRKIQFRIINTGDWKIALAKALRGNE